MSQVKSRQTGPVRSCVGCGERKAKELLLRIVRTPQGDVQFDEQGKTPGRGAYICDTSSCLQRAFSRRRLANALRVNLISKENRETLKNEIIRLIEDEGGGGGLGKRNSGI